jgi:hypothetical protein
MIQKSWHERYNKNIFCHFDQSSSKKGEAEKSQHPKLFVSNLRSLPAYVKTLADTARGLTVVGRRLFKMTRITMDPQVIPLETSTYCGRPLRTLRYANIHKPSMSS